VGLVGNRSIWLFAIVLTIIVSIPVAPIYALPIDRGYSFFETPDASFDFGAPIGMVHLKGMPLGSAYGNTDTIVQRLGELPAGATGNIPVQLVELSLRSSSPVNIGGSFFDVFVTINDLSLPNVMQPDTLPPSMGQIMVTSHDDAVGSGKVDSFFDVFFDVFVIPVGGNANSPGAMHFMAGPLQLTETGALWSHTPPPNYPVIPNLPTDSFFPADVSFSGSDNKGNKGTDDIVPAVSPQSSIPDFPFSYSLVIVFVAVAALYLGIRQRITTGFKPF